LIVVVDNTIVNVALPTLVRDLHASTTSLQWVVDAYTLTVAGLLITFGSLGDRFGRHRALAGGLALFAVGSALAAFSSSTGQLIASRVVMGVGAAAVMPSTLSILTSVFDDIRERAKAIALWSAVTGLGVAIGPTLGGWLLAHYNWSSIFAVNLPIVVVALVGGRFLVPASSVSSPHALDSFGAVLSALGLVGVVYAIIEAPNLGWLSARTLGTGTGGLLVIGWWVLWEIRSDHPMVNLRIFTNARFAAASFAITMIFLALFGWLFLFTQQLQFVLGYTSLQAGVRALPFALSIGVASPIAAALAARMGTKVVVVAGLVVMSIGFTLASTSTLHTGVLFLVSASVIMAVGMGLAVAPATESIMGSLPNSQSGVGSAVNDTTRELGGALGVAVMGSISATIFRSHLHLGGVPGVYSVPARASVGAAVTIGMHAPGNIGETIIRSARHAFLIGADRATLVAAAAALMGAAVTAAYLPARAAEEPPPLSRRRVGDAVEVEGYLLADS
jgi:EmrB/QacA subfamily drug resistance transporter